MRVPLIAGNWKMNATLKESASLTQEVVRALRGRQGVEVVLCPPFTALARVAEIVKGTRIGLGAQNVHWEPKGAYTGEISAPLLKDLGLSYCIVGHSERRHGLGETDSMIHRKLIALLKEGLNGILCVGETWESRQKGKTWEVVEGQLRAALESLEPIRIAQEIVIAYEPVWAIGTGVNATAIQAQEVHRKIRTWLTERIGKAHADSTRIQYGGSVNPENAFGIFTQPDVDGFLVGGASLDPHAFVTIVEAAFQAKREKCSTGSS